MWFLVIPLVKIYKLHTFCSLMRKNTWIVIGLIIVIVAMFYFVIQFSNNSHKIPITQNITTQQNPVESPTVTQTSSNSNSPKTYYVNIVNSQFNPMIINVSVGDTLIWMNNETITETVTSNAGAVFNSGYLTPGQSYSYTFNASGVYNYYSQIHPYVRGTVNVQ